MTGERDHKAEEKPILTKDGRSIAYITRGDNASRIECPLLQLGIGASMPVKELKRSFIRLASDYANVVVTRYYRNGENFPDDVLKACKRIYNAKDRSYLGEFFFKFKT